MRTSRFRGIVVAYCLAALGVAAALALFSSSVYRSEAKEKAGTAAVTGSTSGTFSNNTPIPIADSSGFPNVGLGNPYPSQIAVSGLGGTTVDVNVTLMGVGHTFPGDIGLLLVSPSGQFMVLQSDAGGGTDIAGLTYSLDDQAAGPVPSPITAGTFRPTSFGDDDIFPISGATPPPNDCLTGGPGSCPQAAPAGSATLNATFGGADPNGNWRLYAVDCCSLDSGGISGGWSITITTTGGPTVASANVDRNGDAITDFAIVRDGTPAVAGESREPIFAKSIRERMENLRNSDAKQRGAESLVGPPTAGSNIDWYFSLSGGGGPEIASFGEPASDFVLPTDFDGDGNADIAVWRGVNATGPQGGFFFILRSSDSTVNTVDFGILGDDPTVSGDYDGDGLSDPAVFRCPSAAAGQCTYYYLGSNNNPGGNITFVPWGFGQFFTVFPNVGDFDGDGKHDFCVQTDHPDFPGQGLFTLLRSSDFGVEYVPWGLSTDLIAPGDYDGDGMNDFAVGRNQGGQRFWYVLEKDGGMRGASWGLANDFLAPGDYDGDGLTDFAVFRGSEGNWYVLNSGSGTASGYDWGNPGGDYPLSNWQVH